MRSRVAAHYQEEQIAELAPRRSKGNSRERPPERDYRLAQHIRQRVSRMRNRDAILESGRVNLLAFEHRVEDRRRLPDLPRPPSHFDKTLQHRSFGASQERH